MSEPGTLPPMAYRAAVALNQAADELRAAVAKFPPFNSAHEGYAVILEELDEMWQEVKHGTPARARAEAVQVAAMALRFLVDIPDEGNANPLAAESASIANSGLCTCTEDESCWEHEALEMRAEHEGRQAVDFVENVPPR